MIEAVIFDWIGTLHERGIGPYKDAQKTLEALRRGGIKMSLISIAKDEEKEARDLEIELSGLSDYLDHIIIDKIKSPMQYLACINMMGADIGTTGVADDRTKRGITIGNELGCPTFWIKRGEYAHQLPDEETGQPTYIISTVSEMLPYILNGESHKKL